ncbi:MAG: class I SAM-dependent methyltransferase [Comamonadaceae bacterium]|nr:class I SAM-dependent methyltransferase [Comamonadaceae bacterium]
MSSDARQAAATMSATSSRATVRACRPPHPAVPTDFSSDDRICRASTSARTSLFYHRAAPGAASGCAACARRSPTLYARFLTPGMRVLDLMSSWVSHLPEPARARRHRPRPQCRGTASSNPRLRERVLHDLNLTPELPFADAHFDAVLCTASIEYLTQPDAVFRAVRRVLKPGAPFVGRHSRNAGFRPRRSRYGPMLHPFERLGLVLDYFRRSGGFTRPGQLNRRATGRARATTSTPVNSPLPIRCSRCGGGPDERAYPHRHFELPAWAGGALRRRPQAQRLYHRIARSVLRLRAVLSGGGDWPRHTAPADTPGEECATAAIDARGVRDAALDVTDKLAAYADKVVPTLHDLSGYILKKGFAELRHGTREGAYGPQGMPVATGPGLYAGTLMAQLPELPFEEEGRLMDPVLRENFVERVFVYHRWQAADRRSA